MCYQLTLLINISLQATSIAANIMTLQTNGVKVYQNWLLRDGTLVVKLTISLQNISSICISYTHKIHIIYTQIEKGLYFARKVDNKIKVSTTNIWSNNVSSKTRHSSFSAIIATWLWTSNDIIDCILWSFNLYKKVWIKKHKIVPPVNRHQEIWNL